MQNKLDSTTNKEALLKKLEEENDRKAQVGLLSEFILEENKSIDSNNTLSTNEILKLYEKLRKENSSIPKIPKSTMAVYLSQLANSSESKINCLGRKQGYYLDHIIEKINENIIITEQEVKESLNEKKEKGNLSEDDLYPFLKQWLFEVENERVADISKKRGQGKWANPDLLGLKIDYFFNTPQVELTTIEAKILIDKWEQWIFEAVAHTVFSNRSYFAFIHSEDHLNKIPHAIRHYSERFGVGVLIIAVEPEDYLTIQEKKPFELTEENHKIIEYIPAPFHTPDLKFQKRFLVSLGIKDQKDLLNYGTPLDK